MKLQHVFDSPAPPAARQGRWVTKAPLPLPRSEMAWATTLNNRMHVVGGYGEQRVDRPYHHVYDQASDKWLDAPFLPRGAGTSLAGGCLAVGGGVVIALTRMKKILEVNYRDRYAVVEPGVVNLWLTNHLKGAGYHFAPDPSSQQVCTIGGNVANNSGGPHCLADGVTNAHVRAIEVVLPDGQIAVLGGLDAEPAGLDLRGAFVGGEGTLGVATKIAVTISRNR